MYLYTTIHIYKYKGQSIQEDAKLPTPRGSERRLSTRNIKVFMAENILKLEKENHSEIKKDIHKHNRYKFHQTHHHGILGKIKVKRKH